MSQSLWKEKEKKRKKKQLSLSLFIILVFLDFFNVCNILVVV